MRRLVLPALVAILIGSALPVRAGSLPPLLVTARLYAWQGRWTPVDWKEMRNSEALRIAVQVSTLYGPAVISVHAALEHVSWQRFRQVIQPADVQVALEQTMRRGNMARFQAILRVPVTHPLQFSRVVITVRHGTATGTVTSGVTFEPPTTPTQAARTLSVPQVFSFCAARTRLPFLSYGLAVRGYIQSIPTGGDGPASFVVLAHRPPGTANPSTLTRSGVGVRAWGFVSPPNDRVVTIAGHLTCWPHIGFTILGASR